MRSLKWLCWPCSLVVVALLVAGEAGAQRKTGRPIPAAAGADISSALKKLRSGDEAQIKEGLDELRLAGPAAGTAAAAVGEVLSRGLSAVTTGAAIETLGDLGAEAGSPALAEYVVHRDPKLRRAAAKALTRTKGPSAAIALRRALSDADGSVRGTAASGLGALKAKDAVPDLFVALDHRVHEAAVSIGQLCAPGQCEALSAKVGKLPFDVVTGGLDPVLFRSEIPDDTKIKIVGVLRELGTIETNKFLRDVQQRWPSGSSPRVRQALDQAVQATAGGVK